MTRTLIGVSDDNLVSDLTSLLGEMDGIDIRAVARSTGELLDLTMRLEPDLVFVDEALGVEPVAQTVRDLSTRRPAMAILQVSPVRTSETVIKAMEAGARGVVAYPFAYEDVSSRVIAAIEWSVHMRGVLHGVAQVGAGRGKVIAIVGAKGGVGTTTIAVHLAHDHVSQHPDQRVCLVDVDVEKGDLAAILEVRQSVSIADVAKVAGDLSSTVINDAVVEHESGVNLLLAPLDVREAELVSAEALRSIVALLRREFALVIVDGGGHVSPAQAAVVEIADEALVVTTADVLAIRGMRRRMIAWEALGVREEAAFKVLVNKVDKASLLPVSSVPKLTTAQVLSTDVPFSPRILEASVNDRDPRAVTEVGWWRLMSGIRGELGLAPSGQRPAPADQAPAPGRPTQPTQPGQPAQSPPARRAGLGRRRRAQHSEPAAPNPQVSSLAPIPAGISRGERAGDRGGERAGDRGGIALENVGVLPIALLLCLIAWQVAVTGFTFIYAGHATTAAAREFAVSADAGKARAAADDALPGALQGGLAVSAGGNRVSVTLQIPAAAPALIGLPTRITTTRQVVPEQ